MMPSLPSDACGLGVHSMVSDASACFACHQLSAITATPGRWPNFPPLSSTTARTPSRETTPVLSTCCTVLPKVGAMATAA